MAFPPALAKLRIVDLSLNLAGPYCGQILADLGADVVKVERPGAGDPARAWAPPAWGGDGTLFLSSNRGKRSLGLELGSPEGKAVLKRLVAGADVLIQAFRPDVAERFGLTETALRPLHPRLILCSITAFDQEGPNADRPGYDPLLQAHAGLMSVTGEAGRDPVRIGTSVVDMGAGMWAAIGVLSALRLRDATGVGSHVAVSLEDTALAWGAYHLQGTLATGRAPTPMGSGLGMIVPYGVFPASDGLLMIAAGTDALFGRCCLALGLDALAADARFQSNAGRVAHRDEVEHAVTKATRLHSRDALESRLREVGVPCARVRDMAEVARDPDVLARTLRKEPHPQIPDYRAVALPVTLDGERAPALRPPPGVGEQTEELLGELGYTTGEVNALRESGVLGPVGGG